MPSVGSTQRASCCNSPVRNGCQRQVSRSVRVGAAKPASAAHLFQALLRWPAPAQQRVEETVRSTGEELDKFSKWARSKAEQDELQVRRAIRRRAADDIQVLRKRSQRSAHWLTHKSAWTFPVFLITYTTMLMAWTSEMIGACFVCLRRQCSKLSRCGFELAKKHSRSCS